MELNSIIQNILQQYLYVSNYNNIKINQKPNKTLNILISYDLGKTLCNYLNFWYVFLFQLTKRLIIFRLYIKDHGCDI